MLSRIAALGLSTAALAPVASAQLDAFGLHATPQGSATISYDPVARRLPVHNLGSSGNDGVSIDLGRTYAIDVGWEPISGAPNGGSIETQLRLNGLPPGTRYIGNRAVQNAPHWELHATTFTLGAGGYSMLVLDRGALVGQAAVTDSTIVWASTAPTGATGGPQYPLNPDANSAGGGCEPWETTEWTCVTAGGHSCGYSWGAAPSAALAACCSSNGGTLTPVCAIQSMSGWHFPPATTIMVGATNFVGDTVLYVLDTPDGLGAMTRCDVLGANLGPVGTPSSFSLNYAKIEWNYKPTTNTGLATLAPTINPTTERRLPVNNIGSSGQDGVSIDLGRCSAWDMYFDPIDPGGTAPAGAFLDCKARGIRNGVLDQPLGSLRWVHNGFFDVFADFSDIGSSTHRVVVLDHGTVLLDLPGHTGQVASASAWPFKIGKLGGALECFVACTPANTVFQVNGSVYIGDEIRVLADAATAAVGAKTSVRGTSGGLGSIVLRGITSVGTDLENGLGYCFGNGVPSACPCGNAGSAGHGCANSVNTAGGLITASGISRISADSLVLLGSGMPNSFALYFQGNAQTNGGLGAPFGDGLRCTGTGVVRLATKLNALGTSSYPGGANQPVSVRGQVTTPGFRNYQIWYRNSASFCTALTFNLTNGVRVEWAL